MTLIWAQLQEEQILEVAVVETHLPQATHQQVFQVVQEL
jgi:hypothetical protein